MMLLVLTALVGASALNAYFSIQHTRRQIERNLADVTTTLATSSFPLKSSVLRQMRGLAGADFLITSPDGRLIASSTSDEDLIGLATSPYKVEAAPALVAPILAYRDQLAKDAATAAQQEGMARRAQRSD